jgi:hypothetical protein
MIKPLYKQKQRERDFNIVILIESLKYVKEDELIKKIQNISKKISIKNLTLLYSKGQGNVGKWIDSLSYLHIPFHVKEKAGDSILEIADSLGEDDIVIVGEGELANNIQKYITNETVVIPNTKEISVNSQKVGTHSNFLNEAMVGGGITSKPVVVANTFLTNHGEILRKVIHSFLYSGITQIKPSLSIPALDEHIPSLKRKGIEEVLVLYALDDELAITVGDREFREFNEIKKMLAHSGFSNLLTTPESKSQELEEVNKLLAHHGITLPEGESEYHFWNLKEIIIEKAIEIAESYIQQIASTLKKNGINADTKIEIGNPIQVISKTVDKSSILILGENSLADELKKLDYKYIALKTARRQPSKTVEEKRKSILKSIIEEVVTRYKNFDKFLLEKEQKGEVTVRDGGDKRKRE